ncbi:ATP-dependent Lon protease protein [Salinisphaera shabanensis E1L3A]|uniref:PhoH-like protein n=1 Tax=Salinisphaera shabanensis E1L3A TaxID=1033802 RepID=U2ETB4_9GAMM|nr:PhoH family protein [Salinisphaera shabanensis]ERJ20905.1 ATP-dependent Lon protease protein [Salinisphaera shabanensis E1L3A]
MNESIRKTLELTPPDTTRLAYLCGPQDQYLRLIERTLDVQVHNRGHMFQVEGAEAAATAAIDALNELYSATAAGELGPDRVHIVARTAERELRGGEEAAQAEPRDVVIKTRLGLVRGRGPSQRRYLANLADNDLNFGIGPAGTGKTYLAVAAAVDALESERVRRLLLVRPAVEAGERLGFLPGDLAQKIDPYLRPLYDALYEMLGFDRVGRLIERNVIEIAPLAYMRGRTLNEAFIILDEAQNTTVEQMKMFLTRIGFGSTAVVTGDMTQVDLPVAKKSGLRHAVRLLQGIEGISVTKFSARDVVRHPLVQRIVQAYDRESEAGEHG